MQKTSTKKTKPLKPQTIKVMGLTGTRFRQELKDLEKGKHTGRHCYLCGIKEGEESVAINVSNEEPGICTPKADMFTLCRKVGEFTFEYDLCFHCNLLLDAKGRPASQDTLQMVP